MTIISAQDWELLAFFEVEPSFRHPEDPWPYTDALYSVQQDNVFLSVAIAPANRDVRIILSVNGNRVYEFNAMGVEDVRYAKNADAETLQIVIDDRDLIILRIKPRILIEHTVPKES